MCYRGYPPRNELQVMENIISAANTDNQIHSLLHSELGAQLPLHISLSAPLVLKTEQKSEYEEAVEEAIKSSRVPSFETTIRGVRWQRNFDGTRYFLVLRISKAMMDDELNRLLNCCNACAKQFNLPLLYDYDTATANPGTRPAASNSTSANHDSSGTSPNHDTWRTPVDRTDAFHISIAWQLAAPTLKHKVVIAHPGIEKLKKVVQVERTLGFKVVKLKIGNMVKDIPLRKPT
jgi:U6 snRNA phosphodiesterase